MYTAAVRRLPLALEIMEYVPGVDGPS